MEEEERWPEEISAQEEIDLLKQENGMSIEELRARHEFNSQQEEQSSAVKVKQS